MTTTLGALAAAASALERLGALPLPIAAAYPIAKLVRLAQPEIAVFTAKRDALIKELGVERELTPAEAAAGHQGTLVQVSAENLPAFEQRLKELAEFPVTLDCDPIPVASLGASVITAADINALGAWLV